MRGRNRVAWVVALTIVGVIGVVVPGGAVDKKGKITEFSAGITQGASRAGAPWLEEITAGPDGNVWFTEHIGGRIGRITPTGEITEFPVAAPDRPRPGAITAGPDGNVWFTFIQQGSADGIGRITPTGEMTVFFLPLVDFGGGTLTGSSPSGITTGPDGNLWFTEFSAGAIGRITPTGEITEFFAGLSESSGPDSITAGPDGNLWFTEGSSVNSLTGEETPGGIARITLEGVVTEFPDAVQAPDSITAGCDGNVWFTDEFRGTIGRITPKGKLTEFSPGIVNQITAGPDGNLWYTSGLGIGRITPKGKITEFSMTNFSGPETNAPTAITAGPDGNLWFTEVVDATGNGQIGRISPGPLPKSRGRRDPTLPAVCPRARR
jgi:streptogramin lyase